VGVANLFLDQSRVGVAIFFWLRVGVAIFFEVGVANFFWGYFFVVVFFFWTWAWQTFFWVSRIFEV